QVVSFMCATLGKQGAEIFHETDETVLRAVCGLDGSSSIAEEVGEIVRPDLEVTLILNGYTKHLCDYCDGQRIGKLRHALHFIFRERLIQECVDGVLNTRPQSLNHVGRELLVQQFAQAAVMWWIKEEHPLRE